MNQGTNLGSQIGRWIVLAAVVALLGALLLTIRPVGAQDAPPSVRDAKTLFDYAENGKGPVTTYRATDPENNPIFWTLGGPDAADFTIARGALRFETPPNFEVPTDRANDEDGSGGALVPEVNLIVSPPVLGEGAANNVYKVTVRFGAGGEDGTPGEPSDTPEPDEYDGDDLGEFELTITVTNVNEPGMLVISPMQPQVGTELTGILTDEDNIAPGQGEWQWASSASMTGTFTDIPERSGDRTYRPIEGDLGKYLQATVEYVDRAGADLREVKAVSAYPVRVDTNTSNQDPNFPDQSTLTGFTEALGVLVREVTDRFIPETALAGTDVGARVTAFDDKTDIEVITYSLRDADGSDVPNGVERNDDGNPNTPAHNDGHAASFDIDAKTGQITVSARAMLDADGTDGNGAGATNPYNVVVRAVDGDGDTQNIDVAIHVLKYHEPPMIDRVYVEGPPARIGEGHSAGDRVPTEFSHWEADRTPRSPTTLDADLESGVLIYTDGVPAERPIGTGPESLIEAATYYATDPETPVSELTWSLEGDDAGKFVVSTPPTGNNTTLAFDPTEFEDEVGPDFENPEDKNKDNVYEVTIVVTDGTVDIDGNPHRDELPVTVKVINSVEDNKPGMVKFSNRVPEVGTALKAEFSDPDKPTNGLKWQWYRSVAGTDAAANFARTTCVNNSPDGDPTTDPVDFRYFIDTHPGLAAADEAVWEEIPLATSASYTPGYDEDSDGTGVPHADVEGAVVWSGGDIGVTVRTGPTGNKIYTEWGSSRCLRATVTYEDAVDRTHTMIDDPITRDVNETLEGTFQGTEYTVKPIDEENDKPEFLDPDGNLVSIYQADDIEDIAENTTPLVDDGEYSLLIKDAPSATDLAATDTAEEEDDSSATYAAESDDDILTYRLSGTDKDAFVIVGSIEHPTGYDPDGAGDVDEITTQGALVFKVPPSLDYEAKREYRVTVTATDPSGEHDSVNVIVNITDVNEGPEWVPGTSPRMVVHEENDTADVAVYLAEDPEESGVTYSFVTAAGTIVRTGDPDPAVTTDDAEVAVGQFEDHALFDLSSTRGTLTFKESPNYEDPQDTNADADADNMYQVTVKAEVADDETPRHATIRAVTVTVINVNEVPVFSEATDTLEIRENPDNPEKEATSGRGELYLLNRGVGKPAANLPVEPNLDVGIPMVAVDDDNTWVATNYLGGEGTRATRPVQLIDGLTYTLSGADAKPFHIVLATGQILTREKLDYEAKKTYKMMVKATDPWGLSGSIGLTINVTDVDEQPIPKTLSIAGESPQPYEENGTDAVGDYTLTVYGGEVANPRWSLEGDDASHFRTTGTGMTRSLVFTSSPDYETMADADSDNTYEVTIKVTDPSDTAIFGTFAVAVSVTDVDELGALSGQTDFSVNEGDTDALGTYMLTAIEDGPTVTWSLDGTDMSDFMLEVTDDMSRMLKFSSAPDYESPMGGADNDSNTYMVTVMAKAGGEMKMVEVTVTVDDVDELGTLSGPGSPIEVVEGMDAVATFMASGTMADDATWTLEGTDAEHFSITGGVLTFSSAPDYETPMGGADADSNTYMVTVMAKAGGEMKMVEVTITVENVDELGALSGPDSPIEVVEGMDAVATFMASGTMADNAMWTLDEAGTADFTITGGMLEFMNAPDYENPMGGADDDSNTYMVTVKASAGGEMAMQAVTVMVTNVDELGGMLTADMESPISYMENGTMTVATYTASGPMADNAMWTLDEAGTADFTITGGMLEFMNAPDYENPMGGADDDSNTYMVTVKASAGGEMAMQAVTVEVTDVDELGTLSGPGSPISYMENGTMTVATYTASGPMADNAMWTLDEAGTADFTITGGMLEFMNAPDYENPMGGADDDSNTYMVTVKASAGGDMAMQAVTVEVTDVDELGTLSGPGSPISYMENGTMTVATYTASGPMADNAMWTLDEAGTADFTITGGMLEFMNAPDYENPMGGADDDSNTYMVTVKASAGGEMEMLEVTVEVTDVDELGTLSGPGSPISYMENGTMTVATYTASGPMADNAMWTLDEAGTADFTITGGMLEFMNAPDYENPMGGADDDSNTYMVTVKASAGGEMEMLEVTVEVTDVDELGTLSGPGSPISYMENGTMTVATYTASGPMADNAMWTLDEAGTADFTITGGMLEFMNAPDYENPMGGADDDSNTYMVTVKASAGGEMEMREVTVTVTDVDETVAPAFPSATATRSIAENTAANTNIGDPVAATDPNGDTLTYSLEGTDAASFGIDGSTGQLSTLAALDFETKTAYTVVVKATDPGGLSDTIDVTINVTDVDENVAPAFPSATATRSIAENTAANTNIGDPVAATDPNGDTLTYSLEGTDAASFGIDGSTGQLRTSAALDFETKTPYTVVVKATDPDGLSDTIDVTINVTDVDDGAVTPVDLVGRYDTNGTEGIQIDELFDAIDDYFAGGIITIDQLFQIIDAYFLG